MSAAGEPGRGYRIISFSDGYRVGDDALRRAAHFTSYQEGLAAAASRLGHVFEAFGPTAEVRGGAVGAATILAGRLAVGPVELALVYEGTLEHLEPFAGLAGAHPGTRFLVNLFKSQRHLDTPRERGVPRKDRKTLRRAADGSLDALEQRLRGLQLPSNLILTAETERRALLARALGLPIAGVWPLHSQLAEDPPPPGGDVSAPGPLRVLIQVQWHKATDATYAEVLEVVRKVERHAGAGPGYRWHLAGLAGWTDRPSGVRRRLRALLRSGVTMTERALDDDAYRALFDAHDVLWLPLRGVYNVQSSGKALDALVRGVPVVAPAGTYGATEQSRWVPGAPSYGTTLEAIELLLRMPSLVDVVRDGLVERGNEVRTAYSPTSAVRRLLVLAGLGPGSGTGTVGHGGTP